MAARIDDEEQNGDSQLPTMTKSASAGIGSPPSGAIIAIRSKAPLEPAAYRARLSHIHDLSHLTIEVERAA